MSLSSLEEGDEGSYRPYCETNLVILPHELSILISNFINTTAYHFDWYESSPPATEELHVPSIEIIVYN